MPPGLATGPSSQAVQSRRCQSIGWAGRRLCEGLRGGCSGGGGRGRKGQDGAEGPAPVFLRPPRPPAALRSCPAGRAGAALAGAQPGGPEATSSAVLSQAGPSESKNRRDQQKRLGRAGGARWRSGSPLSPAAQLPCCARTCEAGDGHQGGGGALTLRGRLCYLESVNVF